ncbi:MAG: PfkB family carbohydrate kinase [Litorilinea sp.]
MTEPTTQPEILLIGHVTRDLITDDRNGEYRLGGTVAFAAVTAAQLGCHATIITRADTTTDLSSLPAQTTLHVLPTPTTTSFANVYTPTGRVQYSYSQALPIQAHDIPSNLRRPRAVLLGPLVGEITPDVAELFAEESLAEKSLVVAVPQGWMRRWDHNGRVYSKPWDNADQVLPHLDVLVLSLEDIDNDLSRLEPCIRQVPLVVLTEYRDGSTIYQRNADGTVVEIKIPPRPAQEVDPTGAGDTFATAFVIRLLETGDPAQAARFANITASFGVEAPGIGGIPTRSQVEAYMAAHPFTAAVDPDRLQQ